MTKVSFSIGLAAAILATNAASLQAATTSAKSASTTTSSTGNAVAAPTYAQLRKSLNIDAKVTLEVVRADPASYAGRAVELSAIVTGTVRQGDVRTAILNADNSIVRFSITPEILNGDLLQAGASVQVLALVGQNAPNNANQSSAVVLQPLAVLLAPRAAFVPATGATFDDDTTQTPASYALDQLPPATEVPLVSSKNATTPRAVRPNRATSTGNGANRSATTSNAPISNRAPITTEDSYGVFDAQMPAYRAMVKRFNPKLTPDLVDKIALALLQAGTANGMDPRFLAAIISVESDFDIYCRSSSGAMGLGQLMPFNLPEANITNAWDPVQNVWGTARLLRGHLNDYRNRADGTLLAVAAYNAGPGAVRRAGYRVPGGSQVQRYVWKVYNRYKEFAPDKF